MPDLVWKRSPLSVTFLAGPDGSEHYRRCSGVPYVAEPEPVSVAAPVMLAAEPVLIPEPVSAEPEPVSVAEARAEWEAYRERSNAQLERVLAGKSEPVSAEPDPIAELGDELDEAERMHEAYARDARKVAEWPELRRAILAYGGIGPSPDWPRDWYPGDLYRANGKAPDLVAAEAVAYAPWGDTGDDSAMLDYLQRSWAEWQRAQHARRPRARKAEPSPRPVAEALAVPAVSPRALVADVARLVADLAQLVADAETDGERNRYRDMTRHAAAIAAGLVVE